MMGFLTSLLEEFWTGKGTLQQIGLATPSQPITVLLVALAGGATLLGTVNTLVKAQTGKLEPRCVLAAAPAAGLVCLVQLDGQRTWPWFRLLAWCNCRLFSRCSLTVTSSLQPCVLCLQAPVVLAAVALGMMRQDVAPAWWQIRGV